MLLAIDVGNTHAVFGCFLKGVLKKTWRLTTSPVPTSDEFRANLFSVLKIDGLDPQAFDAVVVSSVVPRYTSMLRRAFPPETLQVIDSSWPFRFEIAAAPASDVGMDRLVNAEAVVKDYGTPAIIVDSGTATTICAVVKKDDKPVYLGGAIMPGIELSIEALASRAAKLFSVELIPPPSVIGNGTKTALQSGILHGYASMIDGMIQKFRAEMASAHGPENASPTVVATGGVSQLLRGITQEIQTFDDDLTLRGIYSIYERNERR